MEIPVNLPIFPIYTVMYKRHRVPKYLDRCTARDHSWFAGFLALALDPRPVIWWPDNLLDIQKDSLVVFPDENWHLGQNSRDLSEAELEHCRRAVILTSVEKRHEYFLGQKIKSVFCPYLHWYLNAIPMRRLDLRLQKNPGDRVFNSLNRRWNEGRFHLLKLMIPKCPTLLRRGFVTASTMTFFKDHPHISKDPAFETTYTRTQGIPIELNTRRLNDLPVTTNLVNFKHIAENIPGKISIQIETYVQGRGNGFHFITEKSMLAMATAQIPMIIGFAPDFMKRWLDSQGFDIFSDIVDQSYDSEPDYLLRIEKAIKQNMDLLHGRVKWNDISARTQVNQDLLINDWLVRSLTEVLDQVNDLF